MHVTEYMEKQDYIDKDKMGAMGWSYGGYAALVAASRTPQLYQCVVAGAAVSDPLMQISYYSARMRGAQEMEQGNMTDPSIKISPDVKLGKNVTNYLFLIA